MIQPAEILLYPDPLFSRQAVFRPVDDGLRAIGERLLATARHHRAYGLAATHIGVDAPVVVVSFGSLQSRDYRLLFNPRLLSLSGETELGAEGSVSLPGIEVDIARSSSVLIGYDDLEGMACETDLSGFPARVAQHEIDQMNGVFFLDRLSRLKREAALRRFRKLSR